MSAIIIVGGRNPKSLHVLVGITVRRLWSLEGTGGKTGGVVNEGELGAPYRVRLTGRGNNSAKAAHPAKVIRASDSSWPVFRGSLFAVSRRMQIRKNSSRFNYLRPPRWPLVLYRTHTLRDRFAIPISLVTAASCLAAQSYLPSNLPAPAVRVIPRGCARLR